MSISTILSKLAGLDLSPLVPKNIRTKAKAVGAGILGLVAVAVQLAVVGAPTGAVITTGVLTVLSVIGVHQTVNE